MSEFFKGMWAWMMEHPFWGFFVMVFAVLGITAIVLRVLNMISGKRTKALTDAEMNQIAANVAALIMSRIRPAVVPAPLATPIPPVLRAPPLAPPVPRAPTPPRDLTPLPAPGLRVPTPPRNSSRTAKAQRHAKGQQEEVVVREASPTRWDRLRSDE